MNPTPRPDSAWTHTQQPQEPSDPTPGFGRETRDTQRVCLSGGPWTRGLFDPAAAVPESDEFSSLSSIFFLNV